MAGFIGESADVVAICDPSSEARARFVKVTGLEVAEFSDYESVLEKADIDAVALTGPNFTHAPTAIAAAQAGKHVFCEKTMAPTVRDCWAMVRACELAKVKLMVGHNAGFVLRGRGSFSCASFSVLRSRCQSLDILMAARTIFRAGGRTKRKAEAYSRFPESTNSTGCAQFVVMSKPFRQSPARKSTGGMTSPTPST